MKALSHAQRNEAGKWVSAMLRSVVGKPRAIQPGPLREPSMPSETSMKPAYPARVRAANSRALRPPVAQIRATGLVCERSRAAKSRASKRSSCMLIGQAPSARPVSCHSGRDLTSIKEMSPSASAAAASGADQTVRVAAADSPGARVKADDKSRKRRLCILHPECAAYGGSRERPRRHRIMLNDRQYPNPPRVRDR